MTQRFVVFGATGLTGRGVLAAARREGVSVTAHVRPGSPSSSWASSWATEGIHLVEVPFELAALRALLDERLPTHVFTLLGTTQARAKTAATRGEAADYEAVDVGLTRMIVEACSTMGVAPHLTLLSSYGTEANAAGAYLAARWRMEQAVRESGLRHLVARPSFIVGDRLDARPIERLVPAVDGILGLAARLGGASLRDRMASITGTDLGRVLVRLALEGREGTIESAALQAELRRLSPSR